MKLLPDWIKNGYLRLIDPVANWLVRAASIPTRSPSSARCVRCAAASSTQPGTSGRAGWFLGLTALFDVLDGTVARRSNRSSTFGAFFDSTLDRVADGAVLGGLAMFYALQSACITACR